MGDDESDAGGASVDEGAYANFGDDESDAGWASGDEGTYANVGDDESDAGGASGDEGAYANIGRAATGLHSTEWLKMLQKRCERRLRAIMSGGRQGSRR